MDSGIYDKAVAIKAVCNRYNKKEWEIPLRFESDLFCAHRVKRVPVPKDVTVDVASEKLVQLRKMLSKAKTNFAKSGGGEHKMWDFCREKYPSGNIWVDTYYLFLLEETNEFADVMKFFDNSMPENARRDAGVAGS